MLSRGRLYVEQGDLTKAREAYSRALLCFQTILDRRMIYMEVFYIWNSVVRKGLARRALGTLLTSPHSHIPNFLIITSLQRRLCRIAFSSFKLVIEFIYYYNEFFEFTRHVRRPYRRLIIIAI